MIPALFDVTSESEVTEAGTFSGGSFAEVDEGGMRMAAWSSETIVCISHPKLRSRARNAWMGYTTVGSN